MKIKREIYISIYLYFDFILNVQLRLRKTEMHTYKRRNYVCISHDFAQKGTDRRIIQIAERI